MPPMPKTEKMAPTRVDATRPGVRHVAHLLDARQHDGDDHRLEQEADAPREIGGDEPPEQRSDGGGDRGRRPDQGVDLLLRSAFEVAVDQRLHGGQQERGAEPTENGPEDDDRRETLGEGHRDGTDGVAEETEHVGALAPEEVADLAADQDERGRDQRLEGDRRLDAAHGRVEVLDDRRDRHVHQRRVDDEHEHRHRQQDGDPPAAGSLRGELGARCLGHGTTSTGRDVSLSMSTSFLPCVSPVSHHGRRAQVSPPHPAGGGSTFDLTAGGLSRAWSWCVRSRRLRHGSSHRACDR